MEGTTEIVDQPSEKNVTINVTVQGPDNIVYIDRPSPLPSPSYSSSSRSSAPQSSFQFYGAINGTFQPFTSLTAYNNAARAAGVPIGSRSSFTAREASPAGTRYAGSPSPGKGYGRW